MATIRDVAASAGVSSTTVSRYLNNRIDLPPATSSRIDTAIRLLDYRPNANARRLSTGKTESIGLVTPHINEPFFSELASAVEDEADRHGYTVFMSATRSEPQREIAAINRLRDRHVDGLIMMPNTTDRDGALAKLLGKRRDVGLVDGDVPGAKVPRVLVENERGTYEATVHLIQAGHRKIAYLGGTIGVSVFDQRRAGYLRALREAGIPFRRNLLRNCQTTHDVGQQAVLELLALRDPPTAILASCDNLTVGMILALRAAGVSVPDGISVVAFDDVPMTEFWQPPLTAIRQPIEALGRQGFLVLNTLLRGEDPPMLTRLPVELISRRSVAAPAARHRRA